MLHFNQQTLGSMDQRYRAAFINSITGFKSLALIGTINTTRQTNLAVFNSLFHIGANPALIGFLVRPDSVERHTLENITATHYYTINHVSKDQHINAHQTSARYPKEVSEFSACNFSEEYKNPFPAPFVAESPLRIGVKLEQIVPLSINGTILVIGSIEHVYLSKNTIQSDGFVDIEQLGSITVSGLDSYHQTQRLSRLSYAKPDTTPKKIEVI